MYTHTPVNIRLRRESNPRLADLRPRTRVSPSRELETSSNFIVSLSTLTDTAELIIGSIICVLSASGTTFSPLIDSLRKPAAKFNTKLNDYFEVSVAISFSFLK